MKSHRARTWWPNTWVKTFIGLGLALIAIIATLSVRVSAGDIRRVVTGLDEHNHSIVIFDGKVPLRQEVPVISILSAANLWITDSSPPGLTREDTMNMPVGVSPPDNGTKFRVIDFAPISPAIEALLPKDMIMSRITHPPQRGIPVRHPMMHRTRSLDYVVVLSGEIDMILDDTTIHLHQGDVVVQQATNHGWINRGSKPCRILAVLVDSKEP